MSTISCTAGRLDLCVDRGSDWQAGVVLGFNIAGGLVELVVESSAGNVLEADSDGPYITVTGAATGAFTIALPRALTATLATGRNRYGIWVTDAANVRLVWLAGAFQVIQPPEVSP
jgi:hypothetical protein